MQTGRKRRLNFEWSTTCIRSGAAATLKLFMETDRPAEYSDWPLEIRKLYDAIIRAVDAGEKDALSAAMKHLGGLLRQREDQVLADAACSALCESALRIVPEEAPGHLLRDCGQAAIEVATKVLSSSADESARKTATKLLEVGMSKFPLKGRA